MVSYYFYHFETEETDGGLKYFIIRGESSEYEMLYKCRYVHPQLCPGDDKAITINSRQALLCSTEQNKKNETFPRIKMPQFQCGRGYSCLKVIQQPQVRGKCVD